MAGTDEVIKAWHASSVVKRGSNGKFQDMSSVWIQTMIELKRRIEQITEISYHAIIQIPYNLFIYIHPHIGSAIITTGTSTRIVCPNLPCCKDSPKASTI